VVVNARSGRRGFGRTRTIARLFRAAGIDARIQAANGRTRIEAVAQRLASQGCRTLVAVGGDGTVSAVASVACETGAALGVIPAGTLNHCAKDLAIPLDWAAAVDVIRRGASTEIDLGDVNGLTFVNNSSIGIYPLFVHRRNRYMRDGLRRWFAVAKAVWRVLRRFPLLHVRMEMGVASFERTTPFVFVGNNLYVLEGRRLGGRPSVGDGRLCVCVARVMGAWGLARLFLRALAGRLREDREFEMVCTTELQVDTGRRRITVARDGELGKMTGVLRYTIRRRALRVLVPE
jgi:diacylglycerol kinase family enzyme